MPTSPNCELIRAVWCCWRKLIDRLLISVKTPIAIEEYVGDNAMHTYTLAPGGFAARKKRLIIQCLIIYTIAVLAGLYLVLRNDLASPTALITLAINIPLFAVLILVVLRRGIKLQREAWASYRLTIDQDSITRQQAQLPDLTLRRDQITRIEELPSSGLLIRTAEPRISISVPLGLTGYADVQAHLTSWQPISVSVYKTPLRLFLLCLGLAMVPIAALVIVVISDSLPLVVTAGLVLVGIMGWSLIAIQRSPNVDPRRKRWIWLGLLVLLPVMQKLLNLLGQ
jgi:hypothetical protein